MEIPIACSLDASGAQDQLEEWRVVLVAAVESIERSDPSTLRLRLRDDPALAATIFDLARREVACCPFFRFALEIDADGIAFSATVPPDAASILDAFATLATH